MLRHIQRSPYRGQERCPSGDMDFKKSWRECVQKFPVLQKIPVKRDPIGADLRWQREVVGDHWRAVPFEMPGPFLLGTKWEVWKWRP